MHTVCRVCVWYVGLSFGGWRHNDYELVLARRGCKFQTCENVGLHIFVARQALMKLAENAEL